MKRALTEAKVLKNLGIEDFRHLTKDKVISMATLIDRMNPDVAKKAIEQFPDFAKTMQQVFNEHKKMLDNALETNAESVKSYYENCDSIIASCQDILKAEKITFEERKYILEKMIEVVKMKGEKDTENKKFIANHSLLCITSVIVVAGTLITAIGGNFKINSGSIKGLDK